MSTFSTLVAQAKDLGVFQFYLPFILMFAIFYGLLERSKIFGKDATAKRINIVIALSFSAFLLIATPVGPAALDLSTILANFAEGTLLITLTILVFLLVLAMLVSPAGENIKNPYKDAKWVVVAAAILVIGVYVSSGGASIFPGISLGSPGAPSFQIPGISSSDLALIVIFVLTAAAVIYASGSSEEKGTPKQQ